MTNEELLEKLNKRLDGIEEGQKNLEKGLRNSVVNNQIEDLKIFIKYVNNINAQDENPKSKRTALHWAAIKGHTECYKLLVESGANACIFDADDNLAHVIRRDGNRRAR